MRQTRRHQWRRSLLFPFLFRSSEAAVRAASTSHPSTFPDDPFALPIPLERSSTKGGLRQSGLEGGHIDSERTIKGSQKPRAKGRSEQIQLGERRHTITSSDQKRKNRSRKKRKNQERPRERSNEWMTRRDLKAAQRERGRTGA